MIIVQEIQPNIFVEALIGKTVTTINKDGIVEKILWSSLEYYDDSELAFRNLFRVEILEAPPGETKTGYEFVRQNDKVIMVVQSRSIEFDMVALRHEALQQAMQYGNSITNVEITQWSSVEPLSWTQQRNEAVAVLAGNPLDEYAVLPGLAQDKGITLEDYAQGVILNAQRHQALLRAAIYLRRTATARLLSETLDTPAKLEAEVEVLKTETVAMAQQLGLYV